MFVLKKQISEYHHSGFSTDVCLRKTDFWIPSLRFLNSFVLKEQISEYHHSGFSTDVFLKRTGLWIPSQWFLNNFFFSWKDVFLRESNTKLLACVATQSLGLPPLGFLNCFSFSALRFQLSLLFVRHTHAQTPTHQQRNSWLSLLPLQSWHLEQPPLPRHFTTLSSFKKKLQMLVFSDYFSWATLSIPSTSSSLYDCVCVWRGDGGVGRGAGGRYYMYG